MSDHDEGYIKFRANQQLVNMGAGEDAASRTSFQEVAIEEDNGTFSRIGRDPDSGVVMKIQDYSNIRIDSPLDQLMTTVDAQTKAERTGATNVRIEGEYFVAHEAEVGDVILGKAAPAQPQPGEEVAAPGEFIGDVETFMNAPFAGLTKGVIELGGNVLGATGLVDQQQVDQFTQAMDELSEKATEGNLPAQMMGLAGEIGGQFVLPAVGTYNKLRALGTSPLMASIVSEAGVGLLGMSPNEENIFNMMPEDSEAFSTVRELLATDPDSGEWTNRVRNATEALILLGGAEGAVRGLMEVLERSKRISKSPVVNAIFGTIDDADGRRIAGEAIGEADEVLAAAKPIADELRGQNVGSIKATPAEKKYFEELLGNKANREELLEEVPSFKMEEGQISVTSGDIDPLFRFVDEAVALEGLGAIPPRLKKMDFYRRLEADAFEAPEDFPTPALAVAPLAAPLAEGEEPEEGVQVASAGSRFIQEMQRIIKGIPTAKTKTAETAEELINTNYNELREAEPIKSPDFNFGNMNTSDEVKQQVNTVSEQYRAGLDVAARGVIPQQVTRDIAILLGETPEAAEAAVKSLPSDVKDLHVRALTMRNMLVKSAEYTDELARIVRDGGTEVSDGDYLRFREQIVRHAQLQRQMKGVQTEIARALSSFRIPAEAGARSPQIVDELLDQLGGRGTAHEMAERWLQTPVDRRSRFAEKSMWVRTREAVFEMWINGLLSGLRTQEINTVGNALFSMVIQPAERLGAAAIGTFSRHPDRVRFREVLSMLYGIGEGFRDGLRIAGKSWREEMPVDGVTKMEHFQHKAITPENFNLDPESPIGKTVDYLGQGIRLPGRGLMTMDEFFKSVGYRSELRALTTRKLAKARDEGSMVELISDTSSVAMKSDEATLTTLRESAEKGYLDKKELNQLYDIMLGSPTDDIKTASLDYAVMITFQKELGLAGQSVQTALRRVPMGRVVAPFIRTPTNLVKEFGRRNPLFAGMMPSVHADLAAGGARRDLALARLGMGTSLMTWALTLAISDDITGGGPPQGARTYKHWRETHNPYSVKIGDTWVPIGRLEPVPGMLFGTVADTVDFLRYSDDEDVNEKVYLAALAGVVENIGDKTYLQGLANFADAYSDPDRYAENYIANLARTIVPFSSMMRDITRAIDPVMRQTRVDPKIESPGFAMFQRILNEIKASTPGFSKDLPAKRTFWAEERLAYEGGPGQAFFAFSTKKIKHSPIDDELVKLSQPLSMPSRRVGNYELDFDQADRLIVLMNETPSSLGSIELATKYGNNKMRTAMNNLVQSDLWAQIESDDVKTEFLKGIRNDYVDAAKEALAREDGEVMDAKIQEDTEKLMIKGQKTIMKQLGPVSTQIKPPSVQQ